MRRARSRRSAWRGRARIRSCCAACVVSNSREPRSDTSSQTVNTSSMPTAGGCGAALSRRASSSITATAALLSAPRMPSFAFSQPPLTSTGSNGRGQRDSVQVPAQRDAAVLGPVDARRAGCPASDPAAGPAPSSSTSSPIRLSSARYPVGAGPLVARRAVDPAERRERVVKPLALCVGGAPHRAPARDASASARWASLDSSSALPAACARAAPTNSLNSGAGRSGRDLNSGWYWEAT